jgi:hypothetical protein
VVSDLRFSGPCILFGLLKLIDNFNHRLASFCFNLALWLIFVFVVSQFIKGILNKLREQHGQSLTEAAEEARVQFWREVVAAVDPHEALPPGDHRYVDRFAHALVRQ